MLRQNAGLVNSFRDMSMAEGIQIGAGLAQILFGPFYDIRVIIIYSRSCCH